MLAPAAPAKIATVSKVAFLKISWENNCKLTLIIVFFLKITPNRHFEKLIVNSNFVFENRPPRGIEKRSNTSCNPTFFLKIVIFCKIAP